MSLPDYHRTLDDRDQQLAKEAATTLLTMIDMGGLTAPAKLAIVEQQTLDLPAPALHLLAEALAGMAKGDAVALKYYRRQICAEQVAEILNVSADHVRKLEESGELRCLPLGSRQLQRWYSLQEVLALRPALRRREEEVLSELADLDQTFKNERDVQ